MDQKIHAYLCQVKRQAFPAFIHNEGMKNAPKTVGERIRWLRLNRKLTQEQLAKIIGIKQGSLTQLERGISKSPSSQTLTKLARVFEVDPEWLMTGKGMQQPVGSLSDEESELLLIYRALSSEGQEYVFRRAKSIHRDEFDNTGRHRRPGVDQLRPPNKPGEEH